MSLNGIQIETFVWDETTTLRDWSRWVLKFEAILEIAKVRYKEQGNTTAVDYLITACGNRLLTIIDAPNKGTIDWKTLKPLLA